MGGSRGSAGPTPQIYDPVTGTYGASLPASDNPMAGTGPLGWRQSLTGDLTKAGQVANALQPLFGNIPGMQQGQQQQQPRYPVNFNAAPMPFIPPPGGGQNGY